MRWWDIERVVPLERDLFGPTAWSAETFWAELAHAGAGGTRHYVVAAGPAEELLGYAGLLVPGPEADVQTIAVARSAQGRGVGAALLSDLLAAASRRGATSLLLEVRADNGPAQRLYARHGFERIAVRRGYYQPGGVDAWVMRRRPLR